MNYFEFESTQKTENLIVAETNVSANDASHIASIFMAEQLKGSSSTKANNQSSFDCYSVKTFSQDSKKYMHLVSYDNGGFVLVSATKDYYPVLAFCDEGDFNIDELNEGQKFWLEMTKAAINNCDKLDDSTKADINTVWDNYERSDINTLFHSATKSTMSPAVEACWDRCMQLYEQYYTQGWIFVPLSEASSISSSQSFSSFYQSMCSSAIQRNSPINATVFAFKFSYLTETQAHLMSTQWHQYGVFSELNNY